MAGNFASRNSAIIHPKGQRSNERLALFISIATPDSQFSANIKPMIKNLALINGSNVSYWVYNPKLKNTILIVHGFRGNHRSLTDFARNFKDYRVVLIDLPGYGQSEPMESEHTLDNFADFVKNFADQLGLKKFTLIGHSFGATICLKYAALQPKNLQKLVLICPAISSNGLVNSLIGAYYRTSYLLPQDWRKAWLALPLIDQIGSRLLIKKVSSRRRQELTQAGIRNLTEVRPNVVVESLLSYQKTKIYDTACEVSAPTLIIAGALDQVVTLRSINHLVGCIQDVRLKIVKDHGHLAPLEQPHHVANMAIDFIKA